MNRNYEIQHRENWVFEVNLKFQMKHSKLSLNIHHLLDMLTVEILQAINPPQLQISSN